MDGRSGPTVEVKLHFQILWRGVAVAYIGSMNYIYDDEKLELRANLSRSLLDHKRLKHFIINYS